MGQAAVCCRPASDTNASDQSVNPKQLTEVVFDCCLLSPNCVDIGLFQQWVSGKNAKDAHTAILQDAHYAAGQASSCALGLERELLPTMEDQFLMYDGLEHYLKQPWLIDSQKLHLIDMVGQGGCLIAMYYSFDEHLARKVMGWKLEGSKTNARLKSHCETASVPQKAGERQFNNFAGVLNTVRNEYLEEGASCSMRELITEKYMLPQKLANSYAQIIFSCFHRFDLGRSLDKLDFITMCKIHSVVSSHWTEPAGGLMLDERFVTDLVDAKNKIERTMFETAVTERFTFENANKQGACIAKPRTRLTVGNSKYRARNSVRRPRAADHNC